jgi:hypothetical protein
MPAPKRPNTAAATEAVRRRGQETMARKLREAGWAVTPPEETPVYTASELATTVGLPPTPEGAARFARFAGAYRLASDYTQVGQIPPRWAGQGADATFTRDEADMLLAEWDRTATAVGPEGTGAVSPVLDGPHFDPQEVADRYWS